MHTLLLVATCLLHPMVTATPLNRSAALVGPQAAQAPPRIEVKVAKRILKTYVGEYELTPERVLTITLEAGRLFGQPTGQAKRQLFAESDTTFFLKDVDVEVTFQKDAKGMVVGLLLDQAGRPVLEFKKRHVDRSQTKGARRPPSHSPHGRF